MLVPRRSTWRTLALALLTTLVIRGRAQTFEVASLRPSPPNADPATGSWSPPGTGRFTATHIPLTRLLQLAYGVGAEQFVNTPAWLGSDLFDLDAKPVDGISLTRDELKPRLQALLEQRFGLRAHLETRSARGYALCRGRRETHLTPTAGDHFPGFRLNVSPGQMRGLNWSMPTLAAYLASATGYPVVDQTGIQGSYDIDFSYDPTSTNTDTTLLPLPQALEKATGLTLREQKVPATALVIDHIERVPAAN